MTRTMGILLAGLAAVGSMASISAAQAAPLLFTLTGSDTFSFTLASPSTPSGQETENFFGPVFYYSSVSGFNGSATTFPFLTFYNAANGGGLSVGTKVGDYSGDSGTVTYDLFNVDSTAQLYSGAQTAPVFATGTYGLTTLSSGDETLVISDVPTAVPETATWAMLLVGLGAIGVAMRRRTTVAVSYA